MCHPASRPRAAHVVTRLVVAALGVLLAMPLAPIEAAEGPRAAAWKRVQTALDEGKPQTALEALAAVEEEARAAGAWAEVARAVATRVLAETGDRPPDDPERIVRLVARRDAAAEQIRGVLDAILANWTWGYFQQNRWRYQQRTEGAADATDIARIAEWDLPTIVAAIRGRFALAVAPPDSAARKLLQSLPVGEWSALIEPGTMPDRYRPTVWDVVVHDALDFAASGERGAVAPEDAFELDAASPVLDPVEGFLDWRPDTAPDQTDADSPLLDSVRLFRELILFHRDDADRTAGLAADLDRLEWAGGRVVATGGPEEITARREMALEAFMQRAEGHEIESLAAAQLAELAQARGDLVDARRIAAQAAEKHPDSPGGRRCRAVVVAIESRSLALQTERSWARPWPTIRVNARNLTRLHLRLARCDWRARLEAGKPHAHWIDDADRAAILALPAVRSRAIDIPAADDFADHAHDLPVAATFDADTLPPGPYWLLASQREDFAADDNVVSLALVWVTRLALVAETGRSAGEAGGPRLAGHVVDVASGEPQPEVEVVALLRDQGGRQPAYARRQSVRTDALGRFTLDAPQGQEIVVVAGVDRDGGRHEATFGPTQVWSQQQPDTVSSIVLFTDRGIHRPGQILFYKGIAAQGDQQKRQYGVLADQQVDVTLRDANGREVATARQTTSKNGSFHGSFPIPAGSLPGQWSLQALVAGGGCSGVTGVRVEEYKRPKFQVELAAPEKSVALGGSIVLSGTATTYTGLPVAGAKVAWRVERTARWPEWCRWFFPGLPFDGGGQRIARGRAETDASGRFTIEFPARPDLAVPKESLPVFAFAVTVDVTDTGGETRSDSRTVRAGYTDVEAAVAIEPWQAVDAAGGTATVPVTVTTTTLDGEPSAATGRLSVRRLVQPPEVIRGDFFPRDRPLPVRPRGGRPQRGGKPAPPAPPREPDPADPATWAGGEEVFTREGLSSEEAGKVVVDVPLAAGIYRVVFEIPAAGAVPPVKAERIVEVFDPEAKTYGVKRPLAVAARRTTVPPGSRFEAVLGTGYETGRVFVEVAQGQRVLSRSWTEPGRTQWPVTVAVGPEHRGGFTVRGWMVRDGRLHPFTQIVDVPWTDKQLEISWERFTRRVEPAAQEVWRATIRSVEDPVAGPAAGVAAEFLAALYDQSLDALAPHAWPGLDGLLRREGPWGWVQYAFTNNAEQLIPIAGSFVEPAVDVPPLTFREIRQPFGTPSGMFFGYARGRGGFGRPMMRGAMPAMALADGAAPLEAAAAAAPMALAKNAAVAEDTAGAAPPGNAAPAATAAPPPPRKNLVETAFFLPVLQSDSAGGVTIEFTVPDTLTTWQFKGFAHDAQLRSGSLFDECVSAKDLMVEPLVPRFVREGDVVRIPVKVSNRSAGRLTGSVRLALFDARTDAARDALLEGPAEVAFDLAAGESRPVVFTLTVADGTDVLRYRATGSAGRAADGEEAFLPVLPRRVPVVETVPVTIRGPGRREVTLERLVGSAGSDIRSESLVVQAASNPAWYAVLALPTIMEQADESTETLFARLYANSLARHLATSDPRIERIFAQWRGTDAVESPLEKNTDLVKTLLAETPWVRDAVDEREARARIGLLFDANRAAAESRAALERLAALRNPDGGWPWFPGGRSCDSVTLGIVAGFGRLRVAGVPIEIDTALAALPWIDARLIEERRRAEGVENPVLTPLGSYALYARSFFAADAPPQGEAAAALQWGLEIGRTTWMKLPDRRSQGHLAISLHRSGDRAVATSIVDSLRQRAVGADVPRGAEPENWQGMWWRDPHPAWWSWATAPIATQAVMIECFDEVAGDAAAVEALKVWLLSRKRTSAWPCSRDTADAVAALLGRGADLLGSQELVAVTVGDERIEPERVEAGTGFFETRLVRREITPDRGRIVLEKPDEGLAFGGVHWLYLDDIANVPAAGRDELAIEKRLFVKRFTKAGPQLEPVGPDGVAVEPGDELVVRLVVTSDRDYEFLELADHRPCLTEPLDVLSGWRSGDGVGWYVAVRDTATQLFFERLPRGTHVFEYGLRAAHRGRASSGFATIRSRYAPEFSAHSASVPLEVE